MSSRLSFAIDELDALEQSRSSAAAARDAAIRRIQSWRSPPASMVTPQPPEQPPAAEPKLSLWTIEELQPWPEWVVLLKRLAELGYFDVGNIGQGEDRAKPSSERLIDLLNVKEATGFDFTRDWATVKRALMHFGCARFDMLKLLPMKDLQTLVGHGCPHRHPSVVLSSKLLRKYVQIDEGDVCSSCSLRSSCSRAFSIKKKWEEARFLDVMRVLLIYGFDHVNGTVENKPLLEMKSVITVVRRLMQEVVKLSVDPIDPKLPRPVSNYPSPVVNLPVEKPKVGRADAEMKRGNWVCLRCKSINSAKDLVCTQCTKYHPPKQNLPGEWLCPRCNFLNFKRNLSCLQCKHKRSPGEQSAYVCNDYKAWNLDSDDSDSDGVDSAAFKFADLKQKENFC